MTNSTGCRFISDEEVFKIFEKTRIQELEQKLKEMTESRNVWRDKALSAEGVLPRRDSRVRRRGL